MSETRLVNLGLPARATPILAALLVATALVACGDDGDGEAASDDTGGDETPSADGTPDLEQEAERSADQDALDEAIRIYFGENFPDEPPYIGDCEAIAEASCSQFRALDAEGLEYFIVGDPQTFEAVAWIVVHRAGAGWEVVAHDLSRGWARGDQAVVAPGPCQDVLPEAGSGEPVECLEPSSLVTVTGGPRLVNGVLYFRIGEGWILGVGLCDPRIDDDCAPTS
jgi:hypothetical protein